jgi:hypothetical protein
MSQRKACANGGALSIRKSAYVKVRIRVQRSRAYDSKSVGVCITAEGADSPSGLDRLLHAALGRLTMGVSPAALWLAYADWAIHLTASPGKCQQLAEKAARKLVRFAQQGVHASSGSHCAPCIEPLPQDHRFDGKASRIFPLVSADAQGSASGGGRLWLA